MYSRRYRGEDLRFEASGGLVNSSLIMQDRETDTYWSIMKGEATAGPLRGEKLRALPGSEKRRWSDWRAEHPETRVLSVRGREHAGDNYASYWRDPRGFRGERAADHRLATKAPVFAFERDGERFAVAHERIEGGDAFATGDGAYLFLYRAPRAPMFASTAAFRSRSGFVEEEGRWIEVESGAVFDATKQRFRGTRLETQSGVDTFWVNWSLNNPETKVLE